MVSEQANAADRFAAWPSLGPYVTNPCQPRIVSDMKTPNRPARRPTNRFSQTERNRWEAFAASHWIFGAKVMAELSILARLAHRLDAEVSPGTGRS